MGCGWTVRIQTSIREVPSTAGTQLALLGNNAAAAESAGSNVRDPERGALLFLRLTPTTAPISGGHVVLRTEQLAHTDSSGYIQKWVVH